MILNRIFAALLACALSTCVFAQEVFLIPVEESTVVTPDTGRDQAVGLPLSTPNALDVASTAAVVWGLGGSELNPVVGAAGDAAAPLVLIAAKVVGKRVLEANGATPQEAEFIVGRSSIGAAGFNLFGALAGGPVGLAAGLVAAGAYHDMNQPGREKSRAPQFDRWHERETR